jgi:hypothetical protein
MTVLLITAVVLLAVAVAVPTLRRTSRWVDATIHAHNAQTSAQAANHDPKENHAA